MGQSLTDVVKYGFPGTGSPWSSKLDGLGDDNFWNSLAMALPAVAQSTAQIVTAVNAPNQINQITRAGVYPIGYRNGIPVYASTPAGVSPNNPYALPSGSILPAGVTPNYAPYAIYPQQQSSMSLNTLFSQQNMPLILMGGGMLLLMMAMK